MRIGPIVIGCLGPREFQSTRTHQQGAQDGSVIRIGHQGVAIIEAAGIAHQILDDLGESLLVESQPNPQISI